MAATSEGPGAGPCLEQVPTWEWFLELGYANGQVIRIPTRDEARAIELMTSFSLALPGRGWVGVDITTTISAADLRYLQVGHRTLPGRLEPIGFASAAQSP